MALCNDNKKKQCEEPVRQTNKLRPAKVFVSEVKLELLVRLIRAHSHEFHLQRRLSERSANTSVKDAPHVLSVSRYANSP